MPGKWGGEITVRMWRRGGEVGEEAGMTSWQDWGRGVDSTTGLREGMFADGRGAWRFRGKEALLID